MSKNSDNNNNNINEDIYQMLLQIGEHERTVNQNIHKFNAYRKAAKSVKEYHKRIETIKEAKQLSGVGDKIAQKIVEFVKEGSVPQLVKLKNSDKNTAINDLVRVSGIGPKIALKLYNEGIDCIEKLKTIESSLTNHQKIGLKYLDEFEQKIPRNEIQKMEILITNKINELNKNLLLTICGSYRRGAEKSGDIDVLITHPKIKYEELNSRKNTHLMDLIICLEKCGLITDRISLGESKFMGVCRLSPKCLHRRIDIRFLAYNQYFCGVLYFTGSDFFNQQMRRHANDMGFTLNEYSLRRLGSTGVPGEPIDISSEKEIFEYIDFPYKEPKDRNI